ncbi:cytochrome P450, partial [Rhexocercosporidium sp. MPI-PUGE-AT-0058]
TETTSSALTFIFYELAKNQILMEELYQEIKGMDGYTNIESLKLLDACIKEGLRFRPPVAFTGSRLSPKGGVNVLGYYLPEGTVITTQSLSLSRQRPDLFPNPEIYDPKHWLEESRLDERRKMSAPFGVGSRRCPGGNMAICQMRLLIAAVVRDFYVLLAPETTPKTMEPFEANG